MGTKNANNKNGRRGKMAGGIIMLGLGVLFLLNNFDVFYLEESWPFILIIVGFALLIGALFKKKGPEPSEIPPPA